jgi:glutamate-5-semialdehyde dehydrogenase
MNMNEIGKQARQAARLLATATTEKKRRALHLLADRLGTNADEILNANQQDLEAARANGLSPALLDRLMLNPSRLGGMAADLCSLADLDDPIGKIIEEKSLPNGLQTRKVRVPLGVVGVIYEARPNVTIDVAGIAILTANAAILRGGSETMHSNLALVKVVRQALEQSGLPVNAIQMIGDPDRARVLEMLHLYEFIDLIIPRGGAGLHQFCRENSRIPVITGGIGICHLFVDQSADLEASLPVIRNAKIQRPSVCNALDTLLVHRAVAEEFLPTVVTALEQDGVTFRADGSAIPYLANPHGLPEGVQPAGPQDFDTEWLSLVLGLKVVDGLDEAIEHIQAHSTAHSDGILTNSEENASRFVSLVDSSVVYVNASTRFTDGSQLGLGAEVAVSTQRLHARGPMGPHEMTSYKWVVRGEYHIRE